jgi:hypothetical protein
VIEDIPCILFVDELFEMYPNAKVILTNRDIDFWHNSMHQTFFKVLGWKSLPLIVNLDPVRAYAATDAIAAFMTNDLLIGLLGTVFEVTQHHRGQVD